MTDTLQLQDLTRDASSYVDPNGFVFHFQGQIYRAIHKTVANKYRALFENGLVESLVSNNGLVSSGISKYTIPEIDCPLVLKHETVWPLSYCVEWCPSMLQAAALRTLELQLSLLERDLMLQDAYPWNILFSSTQAVHVDFSSIVPVDERLLWPAYQQFVFFFLNPLRLCAMNRARLARSLLYSHVQGITDERFAHAISPSWVLRHPWHYLKQGILRYLDQWIQARPELCKKLKNTLAQQNIARPRREMRLKFARALQGEVQALQFSSENSWWSKYYAEVEQTIESEEKVGRVRELLQRLKPTTVLDIGCNTGRYSVLAAKSGAEVIAIDSSEVCVENLYRQARQEGLEILPLVVDILEPTPAFGFMGQQFPSFIERARCAVVMALGVMHHLHVSGRQSFENIAKLMAELSTQACIFEYVAADDANIARMARAELVNYSFEQVRTCLEAHFSVEVFPSDRSTRKLLLCRKN